MSMPDAPNQAEQYRDLAEEYRRLAATIISTEMRSRYLRMAQHYSSLAEAEEPSAEEPTAEEPSAEERKNGN
jgi:hypothetical protein